MPWQTDHHKCHGRQTRPGPVQNGCKVQFSSFYSSMWIILHNHLCTSRKRATMPAAFILQYFILLALWMQSVPGFGHCSQNRSRVHTRLSLGKSQELSCPWSWPQWDKAKVHFVLCCYFLMPRGSCHFWPMLILYRKFSTLVHLVDVWWTSLCCEVSLTHAIYPL